jgi:hypothetical protein
MKGYKFLYAAVLFFLLSPGVLLRIPSKGSVMAAAAVHAVVFGVVLYILCAHIIPNTQREGFEDSEKKRSFTDLVVIWIVKNIIGVDVN